MWSCRVAVKEGSHKCPTLVHRGGGRVGHVSAEALVGKVIESALDGDLAISRLWQLQKAFPITYLKYYNYLVNILCA